MRYRPPGWDEKLKVLLEELPRKVTLSYKELDVYAAAYEAGADDLLRLLEPIIRDKAKYSSLVDLLYGVDDAK